MSDLIKWVMSRVANTAIALGILFACMGMETIAAVILLVVLFLLIE